MATQDLCRRNPLPHAPISMPAPSSAPRRRACRACLFLLAAIGSAGPARPSGALQNWFNDPFIQISADIPDCLAKECERPNAYTYDKDIAAALQQAVRGRVPFPGTSLWVTVQGRVLYIEACAKEAATVGQVEAFARVP